MTTGSNAAAGGGNAASFAQTMGYLGPVMSLVGMANSAIGAYYGAKSAKLNLQSKQLSYEFQQDMAEINSGMIELQAQQIMRAGKNASMRSTMAAGKTKSAGRAAMAARGIQLGVGSAQEVEATTDLIKEIDKNTIESNAVRAAEAERMRKVGMDASATIAGINAFGAGQSAAGISPFTAAGTSLLTGGAAFANSWYRNWRTDQMIANSTAGSPAAPPIGS